MHTNECEMCGLLGVDLALYTCKQCKFLGCAQCINQVSECCVGCVGGGTGAGGACYNNTSAFIECGMCYSKIATELFYCEYCQESGCTFCVDAKSHVCYNCWRRNLHDPSENLLSSNKKIQTQKNKTRGTIESKYTQKHVRKTLENLDRTKKKKK